MRGVVQCCNGAGGGCSPGWDVAAVVERDITGVHGVVGSNVKVACRMGCPHREPAPTLPVIWAKGWGCACGYMRSAGDRTSTPVVRGLGSTPCLPHSSLPSPISTSLQGIASHSHVWGQMSPTCRTPAMGPAPCPCTAWLHPAWVPVAPPALFPSSHCLYPCLAPWLHVTRFSHAEQVPWGDHSPWGHLATRCCNTSQDVTVLGQDSPAYKQDSIASNLRWNVMLGLGAISSMLGTTRPFLSATQRLSLPPPPSQNGLALGRASLPHGTKHRICWEKPFVSNQEHCFLLERLHPAWRDFSCSWMGREGHLGNRPSWREWGLEGRQSRESHASGLGTATPCLAVARGKAPLLCIGRGFTWQPCTHMATCRWLSPTLTLVSPVWSCGKGSPSLTVWHYRVIPRDCPIPVQPSETLSPLHVPCVGYLHQGKTQAPAPGELCHTERQGDGHSAPGLAGWWTT